MIRRLAGLYLSGIALSCSHAPSSGNPEQVAPDSAVTFTQDSLSILRHSAPALSAVAKPGKQRLPDPRLLKIPNPFSEDSLFVLRGTEDLFMMDGHALLAIGPDGKLYFSYGIKSRDILSSKRVALQSVGQSDWEFEKDVSAVFKSSTSNNMTGLELNCEFFEVRSVQKFLIWLQRVQSLALEVDLASEKLLLPLPETDATAMQTMAEILR